MEPEIQPLAPQSAQEAQQSPDAPAPAPEGEAYRGLRWIFIGSQGLRAGWSVAAFILLLLLFAFAIGTVFSRAHLIGGRETFTARSGFFSELVGFLGMLGAAAIVALIEHRRILDYNLTGPRRVSHFVSGLVAGFAALSALVGALAWGGWLHFGPIALSGHQIFTYAGLWGCVFLLVGCVEEGTMRCFLLYTLTRGINFWWALGLIGAICIDLVVRGKGQGIWGVYVIAALGLIPCFLLHLRKSPVSGFWQAAWVTSTFFGFGHTGNNGENWIGIFTAAFVGFVFCVSVKVTGSAWWAIGCHAAWDWAETYFYGAADSGNVATGHYLTTSPVGNTLWSGGADGPEGSLLVLPIILLLLAVLLLAYGRKRPATLTAPVTAQVAD
jgi:hypothetical protein